MIDLFEETSVGSSANNNSNDEKGADFKKKIFGIFLSVIAGLLYGSNMIPVAHLHDK